MPEALGERAVWENAQFLRREGDATWVAPGEERGLARSVHNCMALLLDPYYAWQGPCYP